MIDENLVNDLIQKNVIKEDKKRNVVFQWKDQDGNVVGSDKRDTGNTQFRGIDKGSDIRHAFHFTTTDKPKDNYIFEALLTLYLINHFIKIKRVYIYE